ncbi:MAG: hypothetical protein ABJA37_02890 [Ferruginibacter sp.]
MKKILVLATAALMVTGVTFAEGGKGKKKSCTKECCKKMGKSCSKDKTKTAKM